MNMYWKIGGTAPCILNLSTRQSWVVSFMPQPFYNLNNSNISFQIFC